MSFQEEMQQIRKQRQEAMRQKTSPDRKERFFADSEPFIEFSCDTIRNDIKLQAQAGRVQYDIRDRSLFLSERKSNPHYFVYWSVACRLDLTKDDFYWNRAEKTLMLSEIETLRHILQEMENRLKADGIVPVEYVEKPLDRLEERFKRYTQRRPLCRPDIYRELLDTVREYEKGNGKAEEFSYVGSYFAYFI